ncbi:MAG TPA: STAS/SEC14 domain-containing protein [Pseudomonadota bacterium]|nr:STAS/SEC14 domain-containing protein [Pseudomonadota bacterium]
MQKARIGMHSVEAEADLVHVHWVGLPTLAELQQIYQQLEDYLASGGPGQVLFDLRAAATPGAELRRYAASWWRRHADSVILASYGMSREVATTIELVARGVQLVSHKPSYSMNHLTEAEARAWLAAESRQRNKSPAELEP